MSQRCKSRIYSENTPLWRQGWWPKTVRCVRTENHVTDDFIVTHYGPDGEEWLDGESIRP